MVVEYSRESVVVSLYGFEICENQQELLYI